MGAASFVGESERPLEQAFNSGLDGRLYTDLSRLESTNLVTPSEAFYIRTRYPDLLVPEARWRISVLGLPGSPLDLFLDDLLPQAGGQGTQLMECSGNTRSASFGLLSSADWTGVRLLDAIARFQIPAGATRLLVSGFDQYSQPSARSTPGASWVFTFDQLEQSGAFLATELNGAALPADHGAPVRLVVPGWYGCTCIKWVNELRFVGEDEPATSQMREFASRTHQSGTPELARDYLPAESIPRRCPSALKRARVRRDSLPSRGRAGAACAHRSTRNSLRPGPLAAHMHDERLQAPWVWEHPCGLRRPASTPSRSGLRIRRSELAGSMLATTCAKWRSTRSRRCV
jgi:DMSO/TMAO reductase YedYZ molybdopterin-dependent catalytic subunit